MVTFYNVGRIWNTSYISLILMYLFRVLSPDVTTNNSVNHICTDNNNINSIVINDNNNNINSIVINDNNNNINSIVMNDNDNNINSIVTKMFLLL